MHNPATVISTSASVTRRVYERYVARVGTRVPIFCLNTVLFPGMRLPLHVFEERYRRLVQDVLEAGQPGRFGVVAIREGYEVGSRGVHSAHRVGREAQIGSNTALPDGRYDIEVTGRRRFRVETLDTSGPYLVAEVVYLVEAEGDHVREAAAHAAAAFQAYRTALSEHRDGPVFTGGIPRDPLQLSYFLAAAALLTLPERQALLEATDAASRLRQVQHSLRIERAAMRAVPSLPATEVARTAWSPN